MDEFGNRTVTEALDIRISSPEDIEVEELHASNTERIDLDGFPWAGSSLGEPENTPPAVESQKSGEHSSSIFDVYCCFPTN